jgi:hypothetical protein
MNKHLALAGLLAAAVASPAHADLFKVAVNGGYATIDMKDLNQAVDKMKTADEASGMTVKKNNKLGSAYFVAAEAGLSLLPFIEIGPRIEYLQATPLEYLAEGTGSLDSVNMDATLTSFMLGATTGMDLPLTGLGFQVAAYAGHGYAVVKATSAGSGGYRFGSQFTGGGFVAQLEAKLKYSLLPLLSFDLVGGMRFASVGVLDDGGKPTVQSYDFSGINAGAGLTLGF